MSNLNPIGVDLTSGQVRALAANDVLTNSTGSGLLGDSLTTIACRLFKTATQSVPDSTEVVLTFPSEAFNNGGTGFHSTVTNNSRVTATVNGKFLVTGAVQYLLLDRALCRCKSRIKY